MDNLPKDYVCLDILGFDSRYYINKEGQVFNIKSQKFMKCSKEFQYSLKLPDGQIKKKSKKKLLKECHQIIYCQDDIIDLKDEIWRQIQIDDSNESRYFVSNMGRVKSYCQYQARILKPSIRDGYLRVQINGKNYPIHRLVAQAFIPNYDNLDTVDHINTIKTDNRLVNLQWLTRVDNIKKAIQDRKNKGNYQQSKTISAAASTT